MADKRQSVLVVDADAARRGGIASLLRKDGNEVCELADPDHMNAVVGEQRPAVVLVGAEGAGEAIFEFCCDMHSVAGTSWTPVVLYRSGALDEAEVERALLAGAADFARADRPAELRARVRVQLRNKRLFDAIPRIIEEGESFRSDATFDRLTGIANRRSFETALSHHVACGQCFTFLFLDIDRFKEVNDTYGHDVGDAVLKAVADRLKRGTRHGDIIARWGGDEFCILALGADLDTGMLVAERHRCNVASIEFPQDGHPPRVTISLGVAAFDPERPDVDVAHLIKRADLALYEAKQGGRNASKGG